VSAESACSRLNDGLQGCEVISDAWEFDSFWLKRLFAAAGQKMAFRLVGLRELLSPEEMIQYPFISQAQLRRHRAMSDVDHILEAVHSVRFQN